MKQKTDRSWMPIHCREYIASLEQHYSACTVDELEQQIDLLVADNKAIHEQQSINLNPATNVMNPKAEALLGSGLGSRPSLGYPGDKYEMGLEAIEKIEVLTTKLVSDLFNSRYAEIRLASGALANLYAFMATTKPGDKIIVPPPDIGGHVTHHTAGAAGLYGLEIHWAPVDAENYTVDVDALREQVKQIRPQLITIGGSLNLFPHPVREIRAIADEYGSYVHFDAAHICGLIAGKVWPQPLEEGAHLMSFSTYKSLGGPPAGVILTNDSVLAERLDKIAFPGLTANFDVAKSAALAMTVLDWQVYGSDYAQAMVSTAQALAIALKDNGLPLFAAEKNGTTSHQFALKAKPYGGGQTMAKLLRRAHILTSGIGLPLAPVDHDLNGLRLGTPEIVRWGMKPDDMADIATFFSRVFNENEAPETVAPDVTAFKRRFDTLSFMRA
ncbi:MAG: aminotransferase class I/II-fold pyridoxal phosphate-dependent enzyme [Anaerolineae bacterium]|nr:aminotransferase class I/II-fold pyridoxal phosphate-dependent enzyme [Anaerolineae bacterium]